MAKSIEEMSWKEIQARKIELADEVLSKPDYSAEAKAAIRKEKEFSDQINKELNARKKLGLPVGKPRKVVKDKAGKLMEEAGKKPFYGYKKRGQKERPAMKIHREKLEGKVPKKWKDMSFDDRMDSIRKEDKNMKDRIKGWLHGMGKEANELTISKYMRKRGGKFIYENKVPTMEKLQKDLDENMRQGKLLRKKGLPPKPIPSKPTKTTGVESAEKLIAEDEKPLTKMGKLQELKKKKLEREEVKKLVPLPGKKVVPPPGKKAIPKEEESWWDKITGGDKAEAKRLGMDVEVYKHAKKKVGKGTGLFGPTEEDLKKAAASYKEKAKWKRYIRGVPSSGYDWIKEAEKYKKKLPPVKQPAKKLDRLGQIRQRLKGLIKPDKKYSGAEGLEKAKLYKEMASLGKPSKFGDYWIKTYLGKKPKAPEKTPLPVSVPKPRGKMPSLNVKKIIESHAPKPMDKEKQKKFAAEAKVERERKKSFVAAKWNKEQVRKAHRAKVSKEQTAKDAAQMLGKQKQYEKEEPKMEKKSRGASVLERLHKKKLKFAQGGDVKKYKSDLHREVSGMGPEGKSFLEDKLHGREYEGKLKGRYKEDLDKELGGMSRAGRVSLEKMAEPKDAWKGVKRELEPRQERAERNPIARKAGRHAGGLSLGQEIEGSRAEKAKLREREGVRKSDIQFARGGEALGREIEGSPAEKARLRESQGYAKRDINYAKGGEANWIQGAVKKPGALRAVAAKEGLIKGDQKLSSSDLSKLAGQAKKKGSKLLAKRVALAKTFAKMRR